MATNNEYNERLEQQQEKARAWIEKEKEERAKEEKQRKEEEKSAKRRNRKVRKPLKISLMKKMMLFSLGPLLILGIVVTIYTVVTMKSSLKSLKMESLTNYALNVRSSLENAGDGVMQKTDGTLCFGNTSIGNDAAYLDKFKNDDGMELVLFYGSSPELSTIMDETGNRILNVALDGEKAATVLTDAKVYNTDKDRINDVRYYSVYIPVRDGNTAVGALLACQSASIVESVVNKQIISLVTISGAILLISVFVVGYSSFSIASATKKMEESLTALAEGYLSITVNINALRRNDEIGTMARALQNTAKKMTDVVHMTNSTIRKLVKAGDSLEISSDQTSVTAAGISDAVKEISTGAVYQAEDTKKASEYVEQMGYGINSIVESLSSLKKATSLMLSADEESTAIIGELAESGEKTAEALKEVTEQVHATDKAVAKIKEAVSVITGIADETSLLSLNASIEAARAGEEGKGFAVVAIQIQKLAEESAKAAERIGDAIDELSKDSNASVEVMSEMAEAIKIQQEKLELTRNKFENLSDGINSTMQETQKIYGLSEKCTRQRSNVANVINNLSAISEQNTLSTESTTSAMSDLNSTISVVADSAKNLQKTALILEENVKFFKL